MKKEPNYESPKNLFRFRGKVPQDYRNVMLINVPVRHRIVRFIFRFGMKSDIEITLPKCKIFISGNEATECVSAGKHKFSLQQYNFDFSPTENCYEVYAVFDRKLEIIASSVPFEVLF